MGFEKEIVEKGMTESNDKSIEGIISWIENYNSKIENISNLVKPEIIEQLMSMGFDKFISEKATLMSGNLNVESSLQWIESNKDSKDFREQISVEEKTTISPEEAKLKAKMLQEEIRQKIKKEEEENLKEAERKRIAMGKEMTEQRRIMEEQKKKNDLDAFLREKQKTEQEKQEIIKLIEEEKKRKLKDKYISPELINKSKIQIYDETFEKMYKAHRMGELHVLLTCMKTIEKIASNILTNPNEDKFKKINSLNQNIKSKLLDVIGGSNILELIGFKLKDEYYIFDDLFLPDLNSFYKKIEQSIQRLSAI